MKFSAMLKKLKKSLRRKIRWITLATILIVLTCTLILQKEMQEKGIIETTTTLAIHETSLSDIEGSSKRPESAGSMDSIEEFDPNELPSQTYFGIDDQGHLSLFDGDPETSQIIRTFFQLDIEYLESSLPHDTVRQLYDGILVSDEDEYNSVLSTLSTFAVEVTEGMLER